ncbi:MAG: hypothetical protein WDN67_01295 [Candidatus Moraniibacteriota bacterium]
MQRIRPFLFWLFVALFFATTALVLFYTFGYRFSTSRGIFIYTGSITVSANPSTVSILLDGEPVPPNRLGLVNRSSHIPGIGPGEHFLSVTAPGYSTWEKKVVVESGLSTEFWNVLLGKTDPQPETAAESASAMRAYPSPKNSLIALAKNTGGEFSLDVYNTNNQSGKQVFSLPNATLLGEDEDGVEWSPDAEKLFIPVRQDGQIRYFVVDAETLVSSELTTLTPDGKRKYLRWQPGQKHVLFLVDQGVLSLIDTESETLAPERVRAEVATYDLSGQFLYILTKSGLVFRTLADSPTDDARQVTTAPLPVAEDGNPTLGVYDADRIAFLDKRSGVLSLYNNRPDGGPTLSTLLPEGGRGMQFSDDGKKLLYFTENEVNVSFLREWEVQPVREAGMTLQVARLSQPISFVQWTRDYEHVLYAVGGSVKVIELDSRDRRNIFDLINFEKTPLQILSRFEQNQVYFIEDKADAERGLRLLQFPEPQTFLGFSQ